MSERPGANTSLVTKTAPGVKVGQGEGKFLYARKGTDIEKTTLATAILLARKAGGKRVARHTLTADREKERPTWDKERREKEKIKSF